MDLSSEQKHLISRTIKTYTLNFYFAELEEQLDLHGSKKMLEDYESRYLFFFLKKSSPTFHVSTLLCHFFLRNAGLKLVRVVVAVVVGD